MLAVRSRFASVANRTFASHAEATVAPADKKYKVVVVGAGPGGLSGNFFFFFEMTLKMQRERVREREKKRGGGGGDKVESERVYHITIKKTHVK